MQAQTTRRIAAVAIPTSIQMRARRSPTAVWIAATLLAGWLACGSARADAVVTRVTGTGRTTGHIATLHVENTGDQPETVTVQPAYIPSHNGHQGYVVPRSSTTTVPPGAQTQIPVHGYCSDIHLPPVPLGASMPPVSDWIRPGSPPELSGVVIRPGGPYEPKPEPLPGELAPTVPGSDAEIPFTIDINRDPAEAAPYLLAAVTAIEDAYDRLVQEGKVTTPYSGNRDRERESVVQQTFWVFASRLQGEPYEKEQFQERLETQYETHTGQKLETVPPPIKKKIEQGTDDFWDTFSLVGAEAKVLKETPKQEGAVTEPPLVPAEAAGCTPETSIEHTDAVVNAVVSESYGDEEDREQIVDAIQNDVAADGDTFSTSTPPATAYAIWRADAIGGIASAYAKTVFLKDRGQDWVWSTEKLDVNASGTGTHTLSFTHGPECSAVVVGVALMRLRATSEAFDPLERNIESFRVLNAIKDIAMELSLRRVPPGLSDAIEAGEEAATDPSSDTYASARGDITLTVGTDSKPGEVESRVQYAREGQEDSAITGGGTVVTETVASDVQPDTLTSTVEATATLTAAASGNGHAKSNLESLYATVLIGLCDCPNGVRFEALTDMQLILRSRSAEGAARVAKNDLQTLVDTLAEDIGGDTIDTDGDTLKKRISDDLRGWAEHAGEGKFAMQEHHEE